MAADVHNRVVGLIAIEPQPLAAGSPELAGDSDATLGQLLIHLALDPVRGCQVVDRARLDDLTILPRAPRRRFGAARANPWCGQTRLTANLPSLAAQLELAVIQVRRRIAAQTLSAE